MKVNDYAIIPKGTKVWSIAFQRDIKFDDKLIVKIKNTCFGSDYVFVEQQELLYNTPGLIPTLIETKNEFGLSASKLKPYKVPEPWGF